MHPFHPMTGRWGCYVGERRNKSGTRVLLEIDDKIWSIPREWTDLIPPCPIEIIGKGQALFDYQDLLNLLMLVDSFVDKKSSERSNNM